MRVATSRTLALACISAAVMVLASCASLQRSFDQGNVDLVASFINGRQPEKLAAMSSTPFLVDGEIVAFKGDVAAFWTGIIRAGFRVEGANLQQGSALDGESYRQFADTMEVKTFFAQYVKKDARILEMRTTRSGDRILVIVRESGSSKTIYGFKGPF